MKIIGIAALAYVILNILIILLSLTSYSCLSFQQESGENCEVSETDNTYGHHSYIDNYDCFTQRYGEHC